jgi:RHS repeat-associated protein
LVRPARHRRPGPHGRPGNDADIYDADPLTAVLKTGPAHGTLTLNSDGSFVYTPATGYTGSDSFTYAASDGIAESTPVTVSLTRTNPFGTRRNGDDQPVGDMADYGGFSASQLTGGLQVDRQVAPGVTLVYDGLSQSDPVIAVDTSLGSLAPVPTSIEATLTLGSVTKPTVYYSTTGLTVGDSLRFSLQIDDSTLATGRHDWSMSVVARYSGGKSATRIFTGVHDVVNLDDSGFGPGWGVDGLDRLVSGTGGMLYVTGRATPFWFVSDGSGGYVSPAGPLAESTLTLNVGGTYTLTDRFGNKANFSSTGLITSRVDRNGNTTSYSYTDADSDGLTDELSQITDPFGRTVSFTYTSGRVSSVADFASRTTTLGRDGSGRLTGVTLPDPDGVGSLTSPVWAYAYTSGRLTGVTDPLSRATTFTYDFAGRLQRATRPDTNYEDFVAVQNRGLVDTSTSGSSVTPAALYRQATEYASYTDALSHTSTSATDVFGGTTVSTDALSETTTYARDANGRVTEVTEPPTQSGGGYAVTDYTYDSHGNLTRITYPGGAHEDWVYDTTKNVPTSHTDELSHTWSYTYDAYGNKLTETDPLGKVTTWTYNSRGQVLTMTRPDPDGAGSLTAPETDYAYDSYGRLTTVTNPDSTYRTMTYDTADDLLTVTDELGKVTTYAYDTLGRKTSVTAPDPDGAGSLTSPVTTYAYDAYGNVTSETDPLGKVTTYEYDDRNRMWRKTLPDPDGAGSLTSPVYTYAFDAAGNLTGETDPLGRTTNYEYDAANQRTKMTLPDPDGAGSLTRPFTTYTYDAVGRLKTVTAPDPDGAGSQASAVTTYGYDLRGRQTSVTDPLGNVTTYGYDAASRKTSVTLPDPDGSGGSLTAPVTTYAYDDDGRLTSVTDPLGKVTTYAYDALGRKTSVTLPDPDGAGSLTSPVTTYAYDVMDRVTSVTDPLGKVTSYTYNDRGQVLTETRPDPDGAGSLTSAVTTDTYDDLGRLKTVTDSLSGVTTYAYDADGRRTSLTDPDGNETTWTYDALGRVTAETNELSKTRTFEYDAAGELTEKTDRNGLATTYGYDGIGRLTTETWYASNGTTVVNTVTSAYDAASRLTSVSDNYSAYAYKYDTAGHLTETDNNGTATGLRVILTDTYDNIGRLTRVDSTVNGNWDLADRYTYDSDSRVTKVEQFYGGPSGGGSVAPKRVDLAYDALGRYTSITRYEDLSGTLLVATSTYGYDADSRLTSLDHKKGTTNLANYTWTYDAAGRVTAATNADGSTSYTYDATGQLTGADHSYQTDEGYSYDANGNRTNTGYSTGTNNRLTSDGTWNYTYDDEGNRTRKTNIATGEYVDYTWDDRNRLTQVTYKTSGGTVTKQVTYRYDVNNRRIAEDVDTNGDGTPDRGNWYVYDGQNVLFRTDRNGTVTNRYLHGPGVDQVFADESTTDGLLWALSDNQGTVRDWADYSSGGNTTTVVDHLKYDSFGNITSQSSSTHKPLFAYTGREWDADAGMYYYRARWYDATVGKFIGEDPIGFSGEDSNLSRYVRNSATALTDPAGLTPSPIPPIDRPIDLSPAEPSEGHYEYNPETGKNEWIPDAHPSPIHPDDLKWWQDQFQRNIDKWFPSDDPTSPNEVPKEDPGVPLEPEDPGGTPNQPKPQPKPPRDPWSPIDPYPEKSPVEAPRPEAPRPPVPEPPSPWLPPYGGII